MYPMKKIQWIVGIMSIGVLLAVLAVMARPSAVNAEVERWILPWLPRNSAQQPYVQLQRFECRREVAKKTVECNQKEKQAEVDKCFFEVSKKAVECGIPLP